MLLATALAVAPFAGSAFAQVNMGCASCVALGPSPTVAQLGDYTELQVAVSNPLTVTSVGLVYVIVHNSDGQTVANSSGVLNVGPSSKGTATILVFGLMLGTLYSATFFAVGVNGEGISQTDTVNLTPEQGVKHRQWRRAPRDGHLRARVVRWRSNRERRYTVRSLRPTSSNSTVYGVAYLVLHDSLGQTVDISTALIVLSPGQAAHGPDADSRPQRVGLGVRRVGRPVRDLGAWRPSVFCT